MSNFEEAPSEEGPIIESQASNSIIGCEIVDRAGDSANYFHSYSHLYHQKQMLYDQVRMKAFYRAIFKNKHHFQGKIVLDVGTGTGILAIWAAKAGASKVYAVETTTMASHAQAVINANHLQDVIEVIHASVEDINLVDRSVDVIISAWMGHFLLGESMFDSVIYARDHWLKPTGVMYPSHARMMFAPIRTIICEEKNDEYREAVKEWHGFTKEAMNSYGVDMNVLSDPFQDECYRYFLQRSTWCNLHPDQVIGKTVVIKEIDCSTVTIADIQEFTTDFSSTIFTEETIWCGFAGWFDVHFGETEENSAELRIRLETAPSETKSTHWGQQIFLLDHPPIDVSMGDVISVTLTMVRSQHCHRSLEFRLVYGVVGKDTDYEKTFYLEG